MSTQLTKIIHEVAYERGHTATPHGKDPQKIRLLTDLRRLHETRALVDFKSRILPPRSNVCQAPNCKGNLTIAKGQMAHVRVRYLAEPVTIVRCPESSEFSFAVGLRSGIFNSP
jgi:hypothetical protein